MRVTSGVASEVYFDSFLDCAMCLRVTPHSALLILKIMLLGGAERRVVMLSLEH